MKIYCPIDGQKYQHLAGCATNHDDDYDEERLIEMSAKDILAFFLL